jgi:type 1 glutamine amidotransferase
MEFVSILTCLFAFTSTSGAEQSSPPVGKLKVLIVDGQNNHNWKATTPVMKRALDDSGRFSVDVATSPPKGEDLTLWKPDFASHDVVLSNYNGALWSEATRAAFGQYVRGGGGFVCVHAADNAFSKWREYNEMIGIGGWGGRNESSGPYVFLRDDGTIVRDAGKGRAGSHGPQHEFPVVLRDRVHPITRGMPPVWMHAKDELYDNLRGPAANMRVLATAFSAKDKRGSGNHVPMMMTVSFGDGRVFHTPMGHADYSMRCVGFVTTLLRGTEWAATGDVTIPIPDDFPTVDASSSRDL